MTAATRRLPAALAGLALAAPLVLAGCAPAAALPGVIEAGAWMAQHPVGERPGWVDAMILPGGWADVGFLGAAARQACPGMRLGAGDISEVSGHGSGARLAAWYSPSVGSLPGCGAWTATALTDTGQVVTLACGSIPARRECPLFRYADGYIPDGGDYVRIRPGGGQITGWGSIQVIQEFADMSQALTAPDPGGPVWATAPAGGGR